MSQTKQTTRPAAKGRGLRRPVEADLGFEWGRINTSLLGVGLALLVIGWVALSRRSTTAAPILLVLGYCGFIPAALLIRAKTGETGE